MPAVCPAGPEPMMMTLRGASLMTPQDSPVQKARATPDMAALSLRLAFWSATRAVGAPNPAFGAEVGKERHRDRREPSRHLDRGGERIAFEVAEDHRRGDRGEAGGVVGDFVVLDRDEAAGTEAVVGQR